MNNLTNLDDFKCQRDIINSRRLEFLSQTEEVPPPREESHKVGESVNLNVSPDAGLLRIKSLCEDAAKKWKTKTNSKK